MPLTEEEFDRIVGELKLIHDRDLFFIGEYDGEPAGMSYDVAKKKGYRKGELSWILESNTAANAVLKKFGARRSKTYRIYEKQL